MRFKITTKIDIFLRKVTELIRLVTVIFCWQGRAVDSGNNKNIFHSLKRIIPPKVLVK